MAKRPELTGQIKAVVQAFEFNWWLDEKTGHVRVDFDMYYSDLQNFLQKKGWRVTHLDDESEMQLARKRRSADLMTHVELKPGTPERDDDRSFIEVLHPELNAFIKQEILGLPPEQRKR